MKPRITYTPHPGYRPAGNVPAPRKPGLHEQMQRNPAGYQEWQRAISVARHNAKRVKARQQSEERAREFDNLYSPFTAATPEEARRRIQAWRKAFPRPDWHEKPELPPKRKFFPFPHMREYKELFESGKVTLIEPGSAETFEAVQERRQAEVEHAESRQASLQRAIEKAAKRIEQDEEKVAS